MKQKIFCSILTACLILAIATAPATWAQNTPENKTQNPKTVIAGEISASTGNSSMPVYQGNKGNRQRYNAGVNLLVARKDCQIGFTTKFDGSARFDNFDAVSTGFLFGCKPNLRLMGGMFINTQIEDVFSLNNLPRVDPASRRPTSDMNQTKIGLGRYFTIYRFHSSTLLFNYWVVARGNKPLFNPRSPGKPYVRSQVETYLRTPLGKGFALNTSPALYLGDHFSSRVILAGGIEKTLFPEAMFGQGFVITAEGQRNINFGVPAGVKGRGSSALAIGFRVPFGDTVNFLVLFASEKKLNLSPIPNQTQIVL